MKTSRAAMVPTKGHIGRKREGRQLSDSSGFSGYRGISLQRNMLPELGDRVEVRSQPPMHFTFGLSANLSTIDAVLQCIHLAIEIADYCRYVLDRFKRLDQQQLGQLTFTASLELRFRVCVKCPAYDLGRGHLLALAHRAHLSDQTFGDEVLLAQGLFRSHSTYSCWHTSAVYTLCNC